MPGGWRARAGRAGSWGVRDRAKVPVWHWLSAQFESFCVSAWLWETSEGEVIHCDGAIIPEEGEVRQVTRMEHALELEPGAKRPRLGRYTLTTSGGGQETIEAEAIG